MSESYIIVRYARGARLAFDAKATGCKGRCRAFQAVMDTPLPASSSSPANGLSAPPPGPIAPAAISGFPTGWNVAQVGELATVRPRRLLDVGFKGSRVLIRPEQGHVLVVEVIGDAGAVAGAIRSAIELGA